MMSVQYNMYQPRFGRSCLSMIEGDNNALALFLRRRSGGDLPSSWPVIDRHFLLNEIKSEDFDQIRYATYRTACKFRFLQKKIHFHLVDIWHVIEAFRDTSLSALDSNAEVSIGKLEAVLSSVYFYLNKRLPASHQINVETSISNLLGFLISAYDIEDSGRVKVFSIKVALATLCAGKLVDKLRYVFTQVSDSSGFLDKTRFDTYLKDVLAMPTILHEGPSFGYTPSASLKSCFADNTSRVKLNDFLDSMLADPGPQCLLWLPLMHRMANVENVFHPVACSFCGIESMLGFRYKCQRCANYQLCQQCFWRGNANMSHSEEHEMKEYSTYKSPAKQFTHTLKKGTLRCLPSNSKDSEPRFPNEPEKPINLQHIIPAQPVPTMNDYALELGSTLRDPSLATHLERLNEQLDATKMDDEHRLIARYSARLAQETLNSLMGKGISNQSNMSIDSNRHQREVLAELEKKNREIMREIAKLKQEQEENNRMSLCTSSQQRNNPSLLAELRLLRQRKEELEIRMSSLQDSRRELMVQLESLMRLLRTNLQHPTSQNFQQKTSFPSQKPAHKPASPHTYSRTSPQSNSVQPAYQNNSVTSSGGSLTSDHVLDSRFNRQFSMPANSKLGYNDLLTAADGVTYAMSNLVKELNLNDDGHGTLHRASDSFSHMQPNALSQSYPLASNSVYDHPPNSDQLAPLQYPQTPSKFYQ